MPSRITKVSDIAQAIQTIRDQIERLLTPENDSGDNDRITRIEIDIPRLSPLHWLSDKQSAVKTYWRNRDENFELAGIGTADVIDATCAGSLTEALSLIKSSLDESDANVRYFGGCRFDTTTRADTQWQAFGPYRFVLPRFELVSEPDRTYLACNIISQRDTANKTQILEELIALASHKQPQAPGIPNLIERTDYPDMAQWQKSVTSALESIASGKYEKIVLARRTSLGFDTTLSPMAILARMRDVKAGCYLFLLQPGPDTAFVGCTPERLYYRQGSELETEAIAGTRPRGATEADDDALAGQLKASDKDIREHRLVVQSIRDNLAQLVASDLSVTGTSESLVKLPNVQHLKTSLSVRLNESTSDSELLRALHPTAAVGGYPKNVVMAEIGKLEGFDRGWYAAPVGWLGNDKSEFAVAIRSALISKESLNVYAGAGIVEGSVADSEWQEIENKMSGFMKVLKQ